MSRKKKDIKIDFLGRSSAEVTQSCYKVSMNDCTLLLDYGLYQNQNLLDSYNINHKRMDGIKPKSIDFIFISHANIDHCGALPYLYSCGCNAPIYMPRGNKRLIEIMLHDSAKIMASDADKLSRLYGMKASPLYTDEDIAVCLDYVVECNFNEMYEINKNISCEFKSAAHIINSSQILLTITDETVVKRILYTGDIGSPVLRKNYVLPFDMTEYADIVIGECTYGDEKRNHSKKDRLKDLEKIKSIVTETCTERKKKVLFPVFSMDRLQGILTTLYEVFSNDKNIDLKVVIDTPLGIRICEAWKDIISTDVELWEKVMSWDNICWSKSWQDSLVYQESNEPLIVLASSGMCTNGRSVAWVEKLLPDAGNHICFCGYAAEDTLAYKIKHEKKNKFITIEGKSYRNKCGITSLHSFSSHACKSELLDIYKQIRYNKLYLVHADGDGKTAFANELEEELSSINRTSRVICPGIGDYFYL